MLASLVLALLAGGVPNTPESCDQVETSWDVPGIADDLREQMEAYRTAWREWCEHGGSLATIVSRAFHLEHAIGLALVEDGPNLPSELDGEERDAAAARLIVAPLPAFEARARADCPQAAIDWGALRRLASRTTAEDARFLDAWATFWARDSGGWTWAGMPAESDHESGCILLGDRDVSADYERARSLEISRKDYVELLDFYVSQIVVPLDLALTGSYPGRRRNDRAISGLEKLAKAAEKRDPSLAVKARALGTAVRNETFWWSDAPSPR